MKTGLLGHIRALSRRPLGRVLLYPAVLAWRRALRWQRTIKGEVVTVLKERLAEDPVLDVPEFGGQFAIDRRSHLFSRLAIEGHYEPELIQTCLTYLPRDRDAIDVGANIGFYSVLFGRNLQQSRRVLAIEPTRNALQKLYGNLERNGVRANTIVFEGVVADAVGSEQIHTIAGREEYSSIGTMAHPSIRGESFESHSVDATTVDRLVQQHGLDPGFIKIDVEGAEHRVLAGCTDTLKKHRPVILCELTDDLLVKNGSSAVEVIRFLRNHGYDVVDPAAPAIQVTKGGVETVLCLPRGR